MIHSLDLPNLRTEPSAELLESIIISLVPAPASFLTPAAPPLAPGILAWLTRLIAIDLDWLSDNTSRDHVRDLASQLLASECGRTAAPSMTRTFTIPLVPLHSAEHKREGARPLLHEERVISVQIHEPTLTADTLGLKTWATSFFLARELQNILSPLFAPLHQQGKGQAGREQEKGKTVNTGVTCLEIGSGTGLVGIVAQLMFGFKDTVVSDYLPEILENLERNVSANKAGCRVEMLDWTCLHDSALVRNNEKFQLLLVSDFMYDETHARLVVRTMDELVTRTGHVLASYPLRTSNADYIHDFKAALQDSCWNIIKQGELHGYDDWGGDEGVMCHWLLLHRAP